MKVKNGSTRRLGLVCIVMMALAASWSVSADAQTTWPEVPLFKPYQDKPGKVTKYNEFNYLSIRDESGEHSRQSTGNYWEISYVYDSVFRQKLKFKSFIEEQIRQLGGTLFFQDTTQVHFAIQQTGGNIWGRLMLVDDRVYRLRIIRETVFNNRLTIDTEPIATWDAYVEKAPLPPRINYLPSSVIQRITYSKYHHLTITWDDKDTLFNQKLMGPYWDIKLEVQSPDGARDQTVSTVEVLESYFRIAIKTGGKVLRSRPRELIFILPGTEHTLWVRVLSSMDGVYFVRVVQQRNDETPPVERKYQVLPTELTDTSGNGN